MKKTEKFDFMEAMKSRGAQPSKSGDLEDKRFYYRFSGNNDVQVGIRKTFDRWANSVDFVFSVPKTMKSFERLTARLDAAIKAGNFNPGWGEEFRL